MAKSDDDAYRLATEACVREANRRMRLVARRRRVTTEMVEPELRKIGEPVAAALACHCQPLDDAFIPYDAPDLVGYTSDTHKSVFIGPRLTAPGRRIHYRPFLIVEDDKAERFSV